MWYYWVMSKIIKHKLTFDGESCNTTHYCTGGKSCGSRGAAFTWKAEILRADEKFRSAGNVTSDLTEEEVEDDEDSSKSCSHLR